MDQITETGFMYFTVSAWYMKKIMALDNGKHNDGETNSFSAFDLIQSHRGSSITAANMSKVFVHGALCHFVATLLPFFSHVGVFGFHYT